MPIRVIIADDHQIVREGLRAILERAGLEVLGEAANGHEAIELAQKTHPDIAVVDYAMPLLNGIDAAREILKVAPRTRTILLTMYTEDQYVLRAVQAGLKGFVVKSQASADLVQAIREVKSGSVYLSPGISATVIQAYLSKSALPEEPLTPRERQVLQLIAEGKSTKEVANVLALSYKTAESHRTRIMKKLDIHETATLVRYAVRKGIVQA